MRNYTTSTQIIGCLMFILWQPILYIGISYIVTKTEIAKKFLIAEMLLIALFYVVLRFYKQSANNKARVKSFLKYTMYVVLWLIVANTVLAFFINGASVSFSTFSVGVWIHYILMNIVYTFLIILIVRDKSKNYEK